MVFLTPLPVPPLAFLLEEDEEGTDEEAGWEPRLLAVLLVLWMVVPPIGTTDVATEPEPPVRVDLLVVVAVVVVVVEVLPFTLVATFAPPLPPL